MGQIAVEATGLDVITWRYRAMCTVNGAQRRPKMSDPRLNLILLREHESQVMSAPKPYIIATQAHRAVAHRYCFATTVARMARGGDRGDVARLDGIYRA